MRNFKLVVLASLCLALVGAANAAGPILVDDFESYSTKDDLQETWVKSGLAYVLLSTTEHPRYGANKSMRLMYWIIDSPYAEAIRDYDDSQNWALGNIDTLNLWFKGDSTNDSDPIYVALTDDDVPGHTAVVTHPDVDAVKSEQWQEWDVNLAEFTYPAQPATNDVNLACVKTIHIGVGDRYGTPSSHQGNLYIDDIWLYPGVYTINVKTDLVDLGCPYGNAVGDGDTNDTNSIKWAIEYVTSIGGSTVFCPAGTYSIKTLTISDGVDLTGAGMDETIFRARGSIYGLIRVNGGKIRNFTAYGTSADQTWVAGDGGDPGVGHASHVVYPHEIYNGAVIKNVRGLEARYDSLYIKNNVTGLRVIDCEFDRGGRHVASIAGSVGPTEQFIFSNCRFGPWWGHYHFDIEPQGDKPVRNGIFLNCEFDGTDAGNGPGTNSGSAFLCFKGFEPAGERRSIAVVGCDFKKIYIRIQGIFPDVKFIGNRMDPENAVFVWSGSSEFSVGEFRDAVVHSNYFVDKTSWDQIISGVDFSGTSFFASNIPSWANDPLPDIEAIQFDELMRLATNCPKTLIRSVSQPSASDIDGDGDVDFADFVFFADSWLIGAQP